MKNKKGFSPAAAWLLRIVGSGFFLWLILRTIDVNEVYQHIRTIHGIVYFVLFVLFLGYQFLTGVRWYMLLKMVGIQGSLHRLYRNVLYGQLISRILPTSIGGDSARIGYLLVRYPQKKYESVSATLMDRMIGLYSLIMIAVITLPFVPMFSIREQMIGLALLVLSLILSFLTILGILDDFFLWLIESRWMPVFLRKRVRKFWDVFLEFRKDKLRLLGIFLFSIVIQITLIVSQYLTFRAVGGDVGLLQLFIVLPIVSIITLLPISIGGLGLREASLLAFLSIDSDVVITYSVIRYSFYIFLPPLLLIDQAVNQLSKVERRST
jgi:hypothetical protein